MKTPALAMQQVYTLSKATYYGAVDAQQAARQAGALARPDRELRPRRAAPRPRRWRRWTRSSRRSQPLRRRRRGAGSGTAAVEAAVRRGGRAGRFQRRSRARRRDELSAGCGRPSDDCAAERDCERARGCARHGAMERLRTTELTALNATLRAAGMTRAIVALDSSSHRE